MTLNPRKRALGTVRSPSRSSIFQTAKANGALFFPLLCGLFGVHLVLAAWLPPMEDELYYWAWAQHLQKSYFDHPPMVAYLIRLSTMVWGNTVFGIRFISCLFTFIGLATLGSMTRNRGLLTLFLFTPLVFFGGIMMTPDTPLIFFWVMYLKWFTTLAQKYDDWEYDPVYRAYHATPAPWYTWAQGGIWLGLGLLSKYTMALAPLCGLLALGAHHRFRSWILGYAFHGVVALAFLAPLLHFNYENHWAPLLFQWQRSVNGTGGAPEFGRFLIAQIFMVGLMPLLCLPWILGRARLLFDNAVTRVCFWFFVPTFLFFLYKAAQTRIEANWGVVAYLAFWPLAERLYQTSSFESAKRILAGVGFATGWIGSLTFLVHIIKPLPFLAPDRDRLGKLRSSLSLAREVAAEIKKPEEKNTPVLTGRYQWVSYLRFNQIPAQQIAPYGRQSHFSKEAPFPCDSKEALVVIEDNEIPSILSCFTHRTVLREFPVSVRNKEIGKIALVKMTQDEPPTTTQ